MENSEKTKTCFSYTLRSLRLEKDISQEQLAEKSGVSRQQISRLECHSDNPTLETIRLLAQSLGVSLQDFMAHFENYFNSSLLKEKNLRLAEENQTKQYHSKKSK